MEPLLQHLPMPFPLKEMEGMPMNFKINYAFHLGFDKAVIMEMLAIDNKKFIDVTWLYNNKGYREKIIEWQEKERIKQEKKLTAKSYSGPTPYYDLEDVSITFRVNYAHHFGVPKKIVCEKLEITNKRYIDITWKYDNENYKQRILDYLEKEKKERGVDETKVVQMEPVKNDVGNKKHSEGKQIKMRFPKKQ